MSYTIGRPEKIIRVRISRFLTLHFLSFRSSRNISLSTISFSTSGHSFESSLCRLESELLLLVHHPISNHCLLLLIIIIMWVFSVLCVPAIPSLTATLSFFSFFFLFLLLLFLLLLLCGSSPSYVCPPSLP